MSLLVNGLDVGAGDFRYELHYIVVVFEFAALSCTYSLMTRLMGIILRVSSVSFLNLSFWVSTSSLVAQRSKFLALIL